MTTIPSPSPVDALHDRLREPLLHFIGGEWVAAQSGETFDFHAPTDNRVLGRAASGDARDIDRAAQAAHAAFPAWKALSGKKRRALLYRVADLIEARAHDIAVAESTDTGQPIRFMKSAAVRAAENFRFFADRAETPAEATPMMDQRQGDTVAYWEAGSMAYALTGQADARRVMQLAGEIARDS